MDIIKTNSISRSSVIYFVASRFHVLFSNNKIKTKLYFLIYFIKMISTSLTDVSWKPGPKMVDFHLSHQQAHKICRIWISNNCDHVTRLDQKVELIEMDYTMEIELLILERTRKRDWQIHFTRKSTALFSIINLLVSIVILPHHSYHSWHSTDSP